MIQTNFAFCSVHAQDDIKPTGIWLELSDVAGGRIEISGRLDTAEPINPESRVVLAFGCKQYEMVFRELRKEIGYRTSEAKYSGYFTGVHMAEEPA